jgi:hypothetical protein
MKQIAAVSLVAILVGMVGYQQFRISHLEQRIVESKSTKEADSEQVHINSPYGSVKVDGDNVEIKTPEGSLKISNDKVNLDFGG